jgi:hypothetical protein
MTVSCQTISVLNGVPKGRIIQVVSTIDPGQGQSVSKVEWTLNAVTPPYNTGTITIDTSSLSIGVHTLLLKAQNSCGNWGSYSQSFYITEPCPTVDCDFTTSGTLTVGQNITFTSSDSTLVSHEWTIDGTEMGTGLSITVSFASSGDHVVKHDGLNACGSSCTKTKTVTISPACPTVDCDFTTSGTLTVGQNITFTSSDSTLVTHKWTIDGTVLGTG